MSGFIPIPSLTGTIATSTQPGVVEVPTAGGLLVDSQGRLSIDPAVLPTSSVGLAAGSLYLNGDVVCIA